MIPHKSHILPELPQSLERRLKLIETLARHTAQEHRAPPVNKAAPHACTERYGPTIRETYPELAALWQWLILKYSPDQPRVPAGNTGGGQWTKEDASSSPNDSTAASAMEIAQNRNEKP
jgi:hypothetical protein